MLSMPMAWALSFNEGLVKMEYKVPFIYVRT